MKQVYSLIDASNRSVIRQANAWLKSDNHMVNAYMRVQRKFIDGAPRHCLVLASVEVKEEHERKGYFKQWLAELEKVPGFYCLYVENVMNMHLSQYLIRRGYTEHDASGNEAAPSYFKRFTCKPLR